MKEGLKKWKLKNGRWFYDAPSYVFIKDIENDEILRLLEAEQISIIEKLNDFNPRRNRYELLITKWKNWKIIIDNWYYSFHHYCLVSSMTEKIGKKYDVFECTIGDCDHSFSFKSQKNGKVIRNYVVSNPSYRKNDLQVDVNVGIPLKGESVFIDSDGVSEKVINILYEEGLGFPKSISNIECYRYTVNWDAIKRNGIE